MDDDRLPSDEELAERQRKFERDLRQLQHYMDWVLRTNFGQKANESHGEGSPAPGEPNKTGPGKDPTIQRRQNEIMHEMQLRNIRHPSEDGASGVWPVRRHFDELLDSGAEGELRRVRRTVAPSREPAGNHSASSPRSTFPWAWMWAGVLMIAATALGYLAVPDSARIPYIFGWLTIIFGCGAGLMFEWSRVHARETSRNNSACARLRKLSVMLCLLGVVLLVLTVLRSIR